MAFLAPMSPIIEDRGPIGVRGRRLYRIRGDSPVAKDDSFETGEDGLERAVCQVAGWEVPLRSDCKSCLRQWPLYVVHFHGEGEAIRN